MSRISDPDFLTRSTAASTGSPTGNVYFDLNNLTIELISDSDESSFSPNPLLNAGGDGGGVDLQALYSFFKEMWKSESDLPKYPFPMEAITAEQFEFRNGWRLTNSGDAGLVDSIPYIRNGGWAERDSAGVIQFEYAGIITLGNIESNHRVYYAFDDDTAKIDFDYDGRVNQPILVFTNGGTDERSKVLTVYIRSAPEGTVGNVTGFTYNQATTADIGVSTITTQVYRFPLAEAVDSNITLLDSEITGSPNDAVFDNIRIEYYASPGETISDTGTSFTVGVVIDARFSDTGDFPTLAQIYQYVQLQLRSASDINTAPGDEVGIHFGTLADPLLEFVGATLKTLRQSDNDGVFIEGVGNDFRNDVEFVDDSGAAQTYPFTVSVTLNFNQNMIDDANAKYYLFYSDITEVSPDATFGTATAVLVTESDAAVSPDPEVTGFLHDETPTGLTGPTSGTGASATGGGFVLDVTATSPDYDAAGNGELEGKVLVITSGDNAGRYFITSNTGTSITTDSDVPFDVTDASISYEIKEKNSTGTYNFVYDYTANDDGGRTSDANASVTLVGLGLHSAQYATATGTIEKLNTATITVSNPLERNYADPVGV